MRGTLSIFKDVFETTPLKKEEKGNGRELLKERNELLIHRYYFYGKFTGSRYLLILNRLSKEMHLSVITIAELLQDNFEAIDKLRHDNPDANYFAKKWPHLIWNTKTLILLLNDQES
jgi:hypothetical protein